MSVTDRGRNAGPERREPSCQNAAWVTAPCDSRSWCLPNVPWDILRERVVRVKRLGFEVAGIADHFVDWTSPTNPWLESWTALTGLAAATTSVRLATCVTQIAFRNPAVQLDETRRRALQMTDACEAIGRDPATLRRSFTMFDATARPRGGTYDCYTSVERFEAMVGPLLELGMDEIVVYYPPDERQLPTFERIATDVLPRFRRSSAIA